MAAAAFPACTGRSSMRYKGGERVFRASSYAFLRIVSYHNGDTNDTELYCILQRKMLWFRFGAVITPSPSSLRDVDGLMTSASLRVFDRTTIARRCVYTMRRVVDFFHARCALTRFPKLWKTVVQARLAAKLDRRGLRCGRSSAVSHRGRAMIVWWHSSASSA